VISVRNDSRPKSRPAHSPALSLSGRVLPGLAVLALLWIAGCSSDSTTSTTPGGNQPTGQHSTDRWQEELFNSAVNNLNRLDEFESGEMLPEIFHRLIGDGEPPSDEQADPAMSDPLRATWPEPEMLRQVVNRLNQWGRSQEPPTGWQRDPLLDALPQPLANLPMLQDLDKLEFSYYDGFALREAIWMRDVAGWARGENLDDVSRAKRLFDWTVRNIQLDEPASPRRERIASVPWETLFFGWGTAAERARVFILLTRQLGLDAVMLAVPQSEGESSAEPSDPRPWVVGVLSEGELYLFDPSLGMPIPGPGGRRLDSREQLDIQPATLAQVVADPSLLRGLDIQSSAYPVTEADLQQVVALIDASPSCLEARTALVESCLAGKQKAVLSLSATAQAERIAKVAHVADVRLWTLPYEILHQRLHLNDEQVKRRLAILLPFFMGQSAALREGRTSYLKGDFLGTDGATMSLQKARPSNQQLAEAQQVRMGAYLEMARPRILELPEEQREAAARQVYQSAQQRSTMETAFLDRAKQDASYWLGLIAFQRDNYPSAIDYFLTRTLEASPGGFWTHGAKYNLARAYEASGEPEKAIELYRSDTASPGYHGNRLRAQWLAELHGLASTATEPIDESATPDEPPLNEPAAMEPEISEPHLAESEPSEPEVVEPEVTEPDITEPEAAQRELMGSETDEH